MRDTRGLQLLDRRRVWGRASADQRAGCRNKNGIEPVGLGPGEDLVHAPFGQRWMDHLEARQEVNDNAPVYPRLALPWLSRLGVRRRVARERLNQPSARARQG